MRVRFLHLSDAHLGCKNFYLADKAGERREDFRASMRGAVEYALDESHDIDGVIIAGDLFEYHRPEEELWSFAKGLMSRLLAQDKVVCLVPGHHDSYAYKNSVYRTERLPGVDLFLNTAPEEPRVKEIRGQRVFLYGMAYVPGQTPVHAKFEKRQEKGRHIGIIHGLAEGHAEHRTGTHHFSLDLDTLGESGLDYIALGGAHTFAEYRVGDTKIAYSGSLEGRSFERGETGEKGPVIVEIDDDGVHLERMITNRKTITRTTIDLRDEKIKDASGLKHALNALSSKNAICAVTLSGTAEFVADLDAIHREVREAFHHLELVDESQIVDSTMLRKIEAENTIRGYLVRKLGERIKAARSRLARSPDDPARIRELKVLEAAMKLGVEQFIDDEAPADSIYSLIPDDEDAVVDTEIVRSSVGVERLENRVKAMLESRRKSEKVDSNGVAREEEA